MIRTFKRIILTAILLIVAACVASALVMNGGIKGCSQAPEDPAQSAKNSALNALLDATGVKDKIDAELRNKAGVLAVRMGLSESMADSVVNQIDVKDWQVTMLPESAIETARFDTTLAGTQTGITTYDDPSIVTVEAYGRSLTMKVPESAQEYIPYLKYL